LFTIHLNNLHFFAFHGLHEEEKMLGGEFNVTINASFNTNQNIQHLEQTVDYSAVYQIVKSIMNTPTPLLETIAEKIGEAIYNFDNRIVDTTITIIKVNPPITTIQGSVGITYKKSFQ
jgi:dihydroneopterin aldolase